MMLSGKWIIIVALNLNRKDEQAIPVKCCCNRMKPLSFCSSRGSRGRVGSTKCPLGSAHHHERFSFPPGTSCRQVEGRDEGLVKL